MTLKLEVWCSRNKLEREKEIVNQIKVVCFYSFIYHPPPLISVTS